MQQPRAEHDARSRDGECRAGRARLLPDLWLAIAAYQRGCPGPLPALRSGARWWGLSSPADPAGIPWLGLVVLVLGVVAMPIVNAFSRRIERQADDFDKT